MKQGIRRNREGKYQLISPISNKRIHEEEWIDVDEVKRFLINQRFKKFMEQAIAIDMDFPLGYEINDKLQKQEEPKFPMWYLNTYKPENEHLFDEEFIRVCNKLDIKIYYGNK